MTDINAPQGGVFASISATAGALDVPQAFVFAAYNVPSDGLAATVAGVFTTFRQTADVDVTQAHVLVAGRGRVANPTLRAWTFSLDGHDFYVLRLGDNSTLVYDLYSKQWVDWSDLGLPFWRPNTGTNWVGAEALAQNYGSNVVVGDDLFGLVWFLDPEQPYDENPSPTSEDYRYFERIVMGQVIVKGRDAIPCFSIFLTGDMGSPAYSGAGVTLYTSDDAGKTFDSHGLVEVTENEFSPELSWYSLGQIVAPGRLFKIVDDGAITRIDAMQMNDED